MAKIVRIYLRPGGLAFIDMAVPEPNFNFGQFMMNFMALGLQTGNLHVAYENAQCVFYDEPDKILLAAVPGPQAGGVTERPN